MSEKFTIENFLITKGIPDKVFGTAYVVKDLSGYWRQIIFAAGSDYITPETPLEDVIEKRRVKGNPQ